VIADAPAENSFSVQAIKPKLATLLPLTEAHILLLADTCLLWGHRLSEWCGHGPALEEDIALTNTALDLIGQARALLKWVALRRADATTEDTLAYFREPHEFTNLAMAALDNGDYAHTIARSFLLAAWCVPVWESLAVSTEGIDGTLAPIALNAAKESRMQLRHASDWVIRFGDGTDESQRRIKAGIDALWPYAAELLATHVGGTDQSKRNERWQRTIGSVFATANLPIPEPIVAAAPLAAEFAATAGASRISLLAEMQSLARQHPNASW
jgi:ring-1,2-phenylacetyl-CoA epoxidase subunit PaaC